jgi:hypothetical protein
MEKHVNYSQGELGDTLLQITHPLMWSSVGGEC